MDEVQPFSLDEDFDYDNVVLTPKFTAAEQRDLDEWARKGREEQVSEHYKIDVRGSFRYAIHMSSKSRK